MLNNKIDVIIKNLRAKLNKYDMLRTLTPSKQKDLPLYFKQIVKNCYTNYRKSIQVFFENHEIEKTALQEFYEQYHKNITNNFLEACYKERTAFQTRLKQILIIWIIFDEIYEKRQLDEIYIDDLMNDQDKFIIDKRIQKLINLILQAQEQQNIQQSNLLQRDQDVLNQSSLYDIVEAYENDSQNQPFWGSALQFLNQ